MFFLCNSNMMEVVCLSYSIGIVVQELELGASPPLKALGGVGGRPISLPMLGICVKFFYLVIDTT